MKLSRWNYLYVQLLFMMAVMMAVSLIPDHAREFFGDWQCEGGRYVWDEKYDRGDMKGCLYRGALEHNSTWHWGYRHWLFFAFGIAFAIISIVRISAGWERRTE
jgi:hypothetical protein